MGFLSAIEHRQKGEFDDFWYEGLSGATRAGVRVGPKEVMTSAAVWNALCVIAMTMGTLPLKLYRYGKDGRGREPAREHPLFQVLATRPNPWMPPYRYRSTLMVHLLLWGNAISQVVRDQAGRVLYLIPLHPSRVRMFFEDGERKYLYIRPNGEPRAFRQREIFHMTWLSPDGLVGFNVVDVNREALGTTLAVDRHASAYYRNYARISGYLKHPNKLEKDTRNKLKREWKEAYSGDKAYGTPVLEEGLEFVELSSPARDAELLGNRTHQVQEVARIWNLPPHILKDLSRATFSNIEEQGLELVIHTFRPYAVVWEETIALDLLEDDEQDAFFAKYSMEGLLRGNSEKRSAFYNTMFNIGAFSPNMILELEDMNPYEGGDQRFVPVNVRPVEDAGALLRLGAGDDQEDENDDAGEGARALPGVRPALPPASRAQVERRSAARRARNRDAYRDVIARAMDRIVKREVRAARRALKNARSRRDLNDLRRWMDSFYAELLPLIPTAVHGVFRKYAEAIAAEIVEETGTEDDLVAELEAFVATYADRYALRYTRKSVNQLRRALDQADPDAALAEVDRVLTRWEEGRAAVEGNRESVRADGAIAVAAYTLLRLRMRWVANAKACDLCVSMDGREVDAGTSFLSKGDTVTGGGDQQDLQVKGTRKHPPLHGGCECLVMAAF